MKHRFRYTTCLQIGLLGLLVGLLLAKFGHQTHLQFVVMGFAGIPLLVRLHFPALLVAFAIGINLGLWRGEQLYNQLYNYNQFADQPVTLTGTVEDDAVYSDRGQLEFRITAIHEEMGVDLPGTVRVRGFDAVSVERGDRVNVSGKLRGGYGSLQGFMSFASVEVLARDRSVLEELRSRYFAGVYTALPDPQASLGLGFLVGTRSLLPEELLTALSVTGLTHIVAVSGYNLTILVRLTRRLFAEKSLFLSTAVSAGLIAGFILVTGLSPSIARASVVSALALLAWYYGRSVRPTLLLLAAAAITAMFNPLYLWFDLGWYLSFAAFSGVLILAPLIQRRYFKRKPKIMAQIVLETTCAQLMAVPVIAFVFGEMSMISLLANVLVLPLVPLAMLATFVAGVAGMLWPLASGLVAWPAKVLLTYMTDMVELLARVPWALQNLSVDWLQLGLIYSIVLVIVFGLLARTKTTLPQVDVVE